jgi:hypothetical protein
MGFRAWIIFKFKFKSKLTILYVLEIPPFVYVQSQKLVGSVMASLEKNQKIYAHNQHEIDQKNMI